MKINKAHKIRLYPNNKQETYFKKTSGISRFVYNWGLSEWKSQYESGLKPSSYKLVKQFNSIKHQQFPWVYECSECGLKMDCDLNASINLKQLAESHSERINACGDESSGHCVAPRASKDETIIYEARKGQLLTRLVNSSSPF